MILSLLVPGSYPLVLGGVVFNLTQSGSGVVASWDGSGTIVSVGGNPGGVLNFNNFSGQPFLAGGSFGLTNQLTLEGTDASNGNAQYFNFYNSISLTAAGAGGSDFSLNGSGLTSVQDGDSYSLLVPAPDNATPVAGLQFSDLNPGTYTASLSSGDAADFGSVTLNITGTASVPEPGPAAGLLVLSLATCLSWLRRERRPAAV